MSSCVLLQPSSYGRLLKRGCGKVTVVVNSVNALHLIEAVNESVFFLNLFFLQAFSSVRRII